MRLKSVTANPTFQGGPVALITNILFPVDFSPSCVAMAAYVKRAATLLGATVSLVHVVDPTSYNGLELYVRPLSEVSAEHLAIGRARLDSFLSMGFPVAHCPRILTSGDAATEIARVAKDGGFSLIIMPTHAGIFRRMLLGSTTAKVLNDANCPVLTSLHAEKDRSETLGAPGVALRNRLELEFGECSALPAKRRQRCTRKALDYSCRAGRGSGIANKNES